MPDTCMAGPIDAQLTHADVTKPEMPKKTTAGEKRGSATTKLFRSMSLSSRKQATGKGHSADDLRNSSSGPSSPDSAKVSILQDKNPDISNAKNGVVGEHEKTVARLREAELEIENLKLLLESTYRDELNQMSKKQKDGETGRSKNVIYPSKVEQHETTIEANAVPLSNATPCRECERLRDGRNQGVVEVIALRKYVLQLSEALAEGDPGRRNFLNDFEQKLVSAQTEKETALEELAHVIDQRDQLVRERDKALEEWGRAAGKWDNALDQVDSLMKELNQVKLERDDLKMQIQRNDSMYDNSRKKSGVPKEPFRQPKNDRSVSVPAIDPVSRNKLENAETLRQMSTELTKAQQRCLEVDAKMTSLSEKAESYRRERDHAKEQWRQSVKERKRLHREIAVIVQTRDEAIQKCFSTAEQLDRLKEEYNQLLNRLAKTGLHARSEQSIPCSLQDCKFCGDDPSSSFESAHDSSNCNMEGEEIRITMEKEEPQGNISIARVSCNDRSFIAVMDVSKSLKSHNIRKYDEIVSINDIPMTDADQNLVRSLLQEATTRINMIIRRPISTCQMNFDVDLRIPKKSKDLGFECGLYVKEMKYGLVAEEQRTLHAGDYIVKINGKHLDKVILAALEKVTKKGGDKLKLNITRIIQAGSCRATKKLDDSNESISRRTRRVASAGDAENNRLSLISNDSSISMGSRFSGNSSMGSMSSYADSCLADSTSDISLSKPSFPVSDRGRVGIGIYSPSSEPRLDSSRLTESPDERDEESTCQSNPEDTDTDGSLKTMKLPAIKRKSVSTSQLPVAMRKTSPLRNSTVRSEEIGLNTLMRRQDSARPESNGPVAPKGEGSRIIRLEKKPLHTLGLEVSGGNMLGIYVTELSEDSVLKATGLRIGDRLLKVNSFDLTRATLDHATRTVKLLNTCSYLRIEAQYVPNFEEVLKVVPLDSLYVRTRHAYRAMAPDELSFTVGETLHVINTRANYDRARQSWKWVAQRARKDGNAVEEGLVPSMGSLPDHVDSSQTFQKFESESEELTSDDAVSTLKRGSSERKSLLQRYRKLRKRQSKENIYSVDEHVNNNKVIFYEILSKFSS